MSRAPLIAFLVAVFAAFTPTRAVADQFQLEYEAAVFGILPLGRAQLELSSLDTRYVARATVRSAGLLRLFDRTNLSAISSGEVNASGVGWLRYDLDHAYAKKRRVIMMRKQPEGSVVASITPNYREWGEPPASEADRRNSRDPLSSLMAMSSDVSRLGRCDGAFPTFDGRFRYDLILSGGRESRFSGGGFSGRVLKCDLTYRPVAGYNPKKENERRRLPKGEIWFALLENSDVAPPVRAEVPLPVGVAGLSLRSFRRAVIDVIPAPSLAPPP